MTLVREGREKGKEKEGFKNNYNILQQCRITSRL